MIFPDEKHFEGKVCAKAFIVKDGNVLVTRDPHDADIWEMPGGRLNVNEGVEEGLKREVREELGVEISVGKIIHSEQGNHQDGSPTLFIYCFAELVDKEAPLNVDSHEVAEMKWITEEAFQSIKFYKSVEGALKTYWEL